MSASIRLMLVTDAVGGVWTYSLELARTLREWDVQTVLAVIGPAPSAAQRRDAAQFQLVETGLPLDWTAEGPADVRRTACGLAELAESQGVDIVQLNSAALLADCTFSAPVVVVQHSCVASWWNAVRDEPLPRDFDWRRELIECGLHAADAVVAPSASFAAQLSRVYALTRPVRCIHNGRRPLPVTKRPVEDFVFTVGRLWDDGKNVRLLDDAAAQLRVDIEAVGPLSGPNGTALSFDNLKTPGELRLDAIAERLAARPIFASPALYEPFGLSVLEAAQAGCALVLADIPTFRELWGGAAVFADASDPAAFATAINRLLAEPNRRAELGTAARLRALRYTPEAMASRMAQLYCDLLPATDSRPAQVQGSMPLAGATA